MADGKKYFGSPLYSRYTHNLIHGKKNTLLHGLAVPDLDIMTEWRFEQPEDDKINATVNAYVNDVMVCESHAYYHIIDYNIYKLGSEPTWSDADDGFIFDFTMGIQNHQRYDNPYGGECVFRCWPEKAPFVVCEQKGEMIDNPKGNITKKAFRLIYNPGKRMDMGRFRIIAI